jgi:hypothetical protein
MPSCAGTCHGHDLHVDFAQPIHDRHDHGQARTAYLIKDPTEPEDQPRSYCLTTRRLIAAAAKATPPATASTSNNITTSKRQRSEPIGEVLTQAASEVDRFLHGSPGFGESSLRLRVVAQRPLAGSSVFGVSSVRERLAMSLFSGSLAKLIDQCRDPALVG